MLIQVAPGQSLQTVIDALPADDQPVTIHLAPGVYEEKIALRRPRTCIEGESAETTRITWHDGAAEILPDGKKRGTFRTATLLINARDCALRSVTVENSAYPREQVGQALALYVDGDGFHCEDCTLKSCQDTLFTAPLPPREVQKDGFIGPTQFLPRIPQRQVYRHCRIEGDIDFIFGGAAAWFEDCDIVSIDGLRDHGDKKRTHTRLLHGGIHPGRAGIRLCVHEMPLSGRGRPGRRDLPRQTVARVRENRPAALRTGRAHPSGGVARLEQALLPRDGLLRGVRIHRRGQPRSARGVCASADGGGSGKVHVRAVLGIYAEGRVKRTGGAP